MLAYYCPLFYTLRTRYNTIFHRISFFIMTVLPSLMVVILNDGIAFNTLLNYFLAFIAMQALYECGYLFNDLITTKFEDNPTNRIEAPLATVLLKHLQNLITVRLVVAVGAVYYLWLQHVTVSFTIALLVMLLVDYALHNFYRNRFNIVTMCIMVSLKYFIPCVFLVNRSDYAQWMVILFLSVPLIRTIEYAGKKRYRLEIFQIKNFERFRLIYYMVLNIITFTIYYKCTLEVECMVLPVILLVFRVATAILMNNSKVKKVISKNRLRNGV